MEVNYAKYSYQELLEVKEVIDKDKYPDRYQRLLDEIALRIKHGDITPLEEIEDDEEQSKLWEKYTVYNFDKSLYRIAFTLFFLGGVTYFLANILPAVFHTKLANLPAYKTEVHAIKCKPFTYKRRGHTYTDYNLAVTSYGFTFYVLDMKKSHCDKASSKFNNGDIVTIWYEKDLIYQLANETEVVLPYRYLKRYVWHENVNNIFTYLLGFFLFAMTFFKSFINCLLPHSFIPNQNKD